MQAGERSAPREAIHDHLKPRIGTGFVGDHEDPGADGPQSPDDPAEERPLSEGEERLVLPHPPTPATAQDDPGRALHASSIVPWEGMATELVDAFRCLLLEAKPVGTERVAVRQAAGRVASRDVRSPHPVPHFRRSAMDGYVVWSEDVADTAPDRPVRLRITGRVRMGEPPGEGPARGEAWAIPTGGAVPEHGDRVIPIEQVRREDDVLVVTDVPTKPHVAEPGEEIRPGALLIADGEVIRPGAVGALVACGLGEVEVYRKPQVALIVTGDELVEPDVSPEPGRVRNTNGPTLASELEAIGCEVHTLGIVPDRPEELHDTFRRVLTGPCDVVLTTGGVSVGTQDRVPRTWLEVGVRRVVGRIDLKPGGPFFAGRAGPKWVIGLSGSPAACLTTYHLLVRPLLLRLAGHRRIVRPVVSARLRTPLRRGADRMRALWARVGGEPPEVEILEEDGVLCGVARANGLVLLRPGTPSLRPGSRVPVLCLDRPEDRAELETPPALPAPLVVGVVGASGSGKTAVIEGLLRRFRAWGIEAAAIKHAAHGFDLDRPGSDSDRMARAQARAVLVAGPDELFVRIAAAPSVDRLVEVLAEVGAHLGRPPQVILVEGFSHPGRPVILVGAGKGTADSPSYTLAAFEAREPAQWEAALDDLAARVRSWMDGGD